MNLPKIPAVIAQDLDALRRLHQALAILLQAHELAVDVELDSWQFSLGMGQLRNAGLDDTLLRWFVSRELIHHARETTPDGADTRSFARAKKLCFSAGDCFILTAQGVELAQSLTAPEALRAFSAEDPCRCQTPSPGVFSNPSWDIKRRTLKVGAKVIKRIGRKHTHQALILSSFEELNWISEIDDPLPQLDGHAPHEHLRQTIANLNRGLHPPLLHFAGNGSGDGVRWTYTALVGSRSSTPSK